jgi:5-methylthioribose kinase|tara:strand:+ start:760 stop:2016 length:1257 start_codon:yes stop_codon:yes gene_type:complete
MPDNYLALTPESLPERLYKIKEIAGKVGTDPNSWDVAEVGDGNLNLVFIVTGDLGKVIIKQALPYVRLVGDSWPLTLERAFFEYNALIRQEERDPGVVPKVLYFDSAQGLIAMEYLENHKILRNKLIEGEKVDGLSEVLGLHCARIAFKGSDLYMETKTKKSDVSLFEKNIELMAITENLVFTDPYFNAEMNSNTEGLEKIINILRNDIKMKSCVQNMLRKFASNTETMCHGDLHSGSIMCTNDQTRVIDPEFAFYGPMGFDLGMLLANFLMAYFSQEGHRKTSEQSDYQSWISTIMKETVEHFQAEFSALWNSARNGILFPKTLFEDQGHSSSSALESFLNSIWSDAVGFCGIEMHRRCLSLAHNADFELIEDTKLRAKLEARNLLMGRDLILETQNIDTVAKLITLAQDYNSKDVL